MGPFYRATVATHQMMIPDELLWRIALHWQDLGNNWNQVGWRLVSVDDSVLRRATYVLVMPGLLSDTSHQPQGLLEVTQGDTCHVRATVLPPQINLALGHITGLLLHELQDCAHGFFVQITVTGTIPAHAIDVTRWCSNAGQLMHLGFQFYTCPAMISCPDIGRTVGDFRRLHATRRMPLLPQWCSTACRSLPWGLLYPPSWFASVPHGWNSQLLILLTEYCLPRSFEWYILPKAHCSLGSRTGKQHCYAILVAGPSGYRRR